MKNIIKGLCIVVLIGGLAACRNIPADPMNPVAKNQAQNEDSAEQALGGKKENSENETTKSAENVAGGIALEIPGREDLKTLVSETEFILVVDMASDFEVVRTPISGEKSVYMIDHEYQVTIQEIPKSPDHMQLQAGDTISLFVPVGMQQRLKGEEAGEIIPLFDALPEFNEGEYLLFLAQFPNDSPHVKKFAPSNMNHIYRGVGDEYRNIVSDSIPVIKKDASF
ncbi:hypothetical protein [Planococcus chinensis]|uniref:Lipoprotein n=1 Tax=Planococcus chinensis TaxID=272917 RepID=A0ABW4QKR2_9BACL